MIRSYPRFADQLDQMELHVHATVARKIQPLLYRLRRRTLTKRGRSRLIAALIENAMLTGQVDETLAMMSVVERYWITCPLRYLPSLWPSPKPVEIAHPHPYGSFS